MDYILAIDQGTHASRAVVIDRLGRSIVSRLLPVELTRPQNGHAEQDAQRILLSVQQVVNAVLESLTGRQRDAVSACGITTQRSTVLAWRPDGSPLSAALSWQDTRGAPRIAGLKPHADSIRRLSGLPLSAHYGASKLHWLSRAYNFCAGLRLGPLAAFLLDNLTDVHGRCRIDHSNAQRLQLLDIRQLRWSPALLEWFDVPVEHLPDCAPVCADYGMLSGHGIPVTAVCGDQNAARFADGPADDDSALVNLGSGAFILSAPSRDIADSGLLTSIAFSHERDCLYLSEGTVNGAGSALEWLQQQHPGSDITGSLTDWLQADITPPLFINSVGGLGSPWWRRIEPAFYPDSSRHSLAERAVAVAESILFLLQTNLELLQRQRPIRRLRIGGGLSRIDPLCQRLADLAGLPVLRPDSSEASARGVAWLAAGRSGDWSASDSTQLFQPRSDSGLTARYKRFREQLLQRIESLPHE